MSADFDAKRVKAFVLGGARIEKNGELREAKNEWEK